MAAPTKHMDSETEKVYFPLRSGASLVKTKPLFSYDSKCLFVCSGSVIKVFSIQSGECIHELRGHKDYVTGLAIHPKNKLQLLSCSLDRKIIVWDYTDGIFLRDIRLKSCLYGIYPIEGENKVYVLQQDQSTKQFCVLYDIPLSRSSGQKPSQKHQPCSLDSRKTAVCPKGSYIATVQGRKLVWKYLKQQKAYKLKLESGIQFTCVISHPCRDSITTGSSDGKIQTWYVRQDKLMNTGFHWHSLPVKDICYTVEGSYLLSGGYEFVLVKWHPESGYRDYLPRLGAPLNHIVCSRDNLFYAVCHDDNVVQVITSNLVIKNVYQGLTRCYLQNKVKESFPAGMNFDPRSNALVLNGKPGHIQFYSVHDDKQLFNLDIVCQNYVSAEWVDKPLPVTDVVQMDFDSTGNWLATVEHWNDGVMTPEMRLKFWHFNEEKQCFVLNTSVEVPHDSSVHSLKFRPLHSQSSPGLEHLAVTSSSDGKFKIWNLVDDTDIYRSNEKWTCEAVGFYRNLPAGQADFSEDGSLLAVAFGPNVTLWNPETNLLKETLFNALSQDSIRNVMFGQHDCSHYLVSTTDNVLTVWNLISCSVVWSADVHVVCLTKDPCSDIMAAFTQSKDLIVFKPNNPSPVFSANGVSATAVLTATFVPHHKKSCYEKTTLSWQSKSELYFINKEQELLSVSSEKDSQSVRKQEDVVSLQQNLPQSALSLLVGRHSNKAKQQQQLALQPSGKFTREMLSSAAHVQPSVMSLCQPFVQSLLMPSHGQRRSNTDESDDDDSADEKFTPQTVSQDSGLDSDMETDDVVTQSNVSKMSMSQTDTDSEDDVRNKPNVKKTCAMKSDKIVTGVCEKFDVFKLDTTSENVSDDQLTEIFASDLSWYKVK